MDGQIRRAKALLESKGYEVTPQVYGTSYDDEEYIARINLKDYIPHIKDEEDYNLVLEEIADSYELDPSQLSVEGGILYLEDISPDLYDRIYQSIGRILSRLKTMYRIGVEDAVQEFLDKEAEYNAMSPREVLALVRKRSPLSEDSIDDIALAASCEAHNLPYVAVDGRHWVDAVEDLTGESIKSITMRRG